MSIGVWQIVIIVLIILVFFGRGKISAFLKDLGKGVTSFKAGLKEGEEEQKKVAHKKSAPKKKTSAKAKSSSKK